MGLGLEEADSGVELGWDVDVLVFHGEDADEGGVVGADVRYVGVFPLTQEGVAVAAVGVVGGLDGDTGCELGELGDYGEEGVDGDVEDEGGEEGVVEDEVHADLSVSKLHLLCQR